MASIVVCGGSMIGLSTAMMLARDGHDVTVLEKDPAPVPGSLTEAWTSWERPGVPQLRQPHNLFPRTRAVLDAELPGMVDRLVDAWVHLGRLARAPAAVDDRQRSSTGRRQVPVRHRSSPCRRVGVRQRSGRTRRGDGPAGVGVAELLVGTSVLEGVPHIVGVRTTEGDELRADLVVDAMGRRSSLVDWLQQLGAARDPDHIRGLRLRLLHALLQGRRAARDVRTTAEPDGDLLDPDPAR